MSVSPKSGETDIFGSIDRFNRLLEENASEYKFGFNSKSDNHLGKQSILGSIFSHVLLQISYTL